MYATIALIGLMTLTPAASELPDTACAIVQAVQQDDSCDPRSDEPLHVAIPRPGEANPNPALPPQPCLRPRREVPRGAVTLARVLVELVRASSR